MHALGSFAYGLPPDPPYRGPLLATARRNAERLGSSKVVFLGSVATPKYLDPLGEVFGNALCVPKAFVGLGNMQRGSMLLQAVNARRELEYIEVNVPQ